MTKPRRFKATVGSSGIKLKGIVKIDTMLIGGRPVIHMVDQDTNFSAAAFLKNQTSREIWKEIKGIWCLVYMGPDLLMVDQGRS